MHVVFDLDGVLLDSESDLSWLWRGLDAALDELGLGATRDNRARLYPVDRDGLERTAAEIGIGPERLWRVRDRHYTRSKRRAIERGEIGPFDDVESLAGLLPDHDLHVISDSPTAVVEAFVDAYGYDGWFEVLVGRGSDLGSLERLKPHPAPFRRLERRVDCGDGFVYIGDAAVDREFAAAVDVPFLHLTRDGRGLATLTEVCDRIASR